MTFLKLPLVFSRRRVCAGSHAAGRRFCDISAYVCVKFVFQLGLQSVEKASHLAGWPSARPGDGLQLWH